MSTTRGGRKRPAHHPAGTDAQQRREDNAGRRSHAGAKPERDVHVADGVRLQKVMAAAGIGSRRACEELIAEGRVEVDGIIVRELGVRVDPEKSVIQVDGTRVRMDTDRITVALNKPVGVVSTMNDPEGRQTIAEFVYNRGERLFHIGRLDAESEGLLLFTNDGELAHRLSHPRYHVTKVYLVEVQGRFTPAAGRALVDGVELDDGPASVDTVKIVDTSPTETMVEVQLHEGRNRIVRRLFDQVGFPVTRLVRTQVGPIKLGTLRPGSTRVLGKTELGTLMSLVGL